MMQHIMQWEYQPIADWEVRSIETCNVEENVLADLSQAVLNWENDNCLGITTQIPTVKECFI